LTELRQLEISAMSVNVFPELSLLGNLKVLKLSLGKITRVSPLLPTVESLRYFSLTGLVMFSKFPPEIYQLVNIEELHFELRDIFFIPEEFGNLINLRIVSFYDCNKMAYLPNSLDKLKKWKKYI
jgi:Leucine-rich repeat (LRR) protein